MQLPAVPLACTRIIAVKTNQLRPPLRVKVSPYQISLKLVQWFSRRSVTGRVTFEFIKSASIYYYNYVIKRFGLDGCSLTSTIQYELYSNNSHHATTFHALHSTYECFN